MQPRRPDSVGASDIKPFLRLLEGLREQARLREQAQRTKAIKTALLKIALGPTVNLDLSPQGLDESLKDPGVEPLILLTQIRNAMKSPEVQGDPEFAANLRAIERIEVSKIRANVGKSVTPVRRISLRRRGRSQPHGRGNLAFSGSRRSRSHSPQSSDDDSGGDDTGPHLGGTRARHPIGRGLLEGRRRS